MRIMVMRNWERPIRIAVIMVMALTLLSPLGSVVFADDGTEGDPPVTEESGPPPDEESEGEPSAPADTPPVEDAEPVADEAAFEEDAEPAADDVAIEDEACPVEEVDAAAEASDADESSTVIDPYFYYSGTEYNYTSIQDAIDYLSTNGWTPDGGLIIVEDGTFTENVTIDGNAWNGGADTPTELILQSENGSGATIIDGTVIIQNMLDFILNGFDVTEGVEAINNTGSLTIEDVVATSSNGDAIAVENHTGDVEITNVNASNASNGTVGDNIGNGIFVDVNAGGSISLTNVTANNNEESGALLVFDGDDENNVITVADSTFKLNDQFGVWAQPEDGTVTFSCVKAAANELDAVMVPVGEEVIWIKCEPKEDKEEEYEDCKIDDEAGKYVNVGDGMMVEFPPIDPIVDEDASYASYLVIDKPKQLPANLPEGDTFMVGIDIIFYNAEIPEGETIKIEFFIAGYQWEETFAVLWFDVDAAEWVEIPFTKEPHERIPGGKIVAEWDQPGTFVLVLRNEVVSDS